MEEWLYAFGTEIKYVIAVIVIVVGFVGGYLFGRLNNRILRAAGVPEAIESTSLERTARKFGTDTVALIARGSSWIVYVISLLYALEIADLVRTGVLLSQFAHLLPSYLLAIFIAIVGLLLADKAEVMTDEYFRSVKIPEIHLVSSLVRYTIAFVTLLLAIAQLGIAVEALLVLLAAYLLGLIVFASIAFHQLLVSAATGLYLIFHEPYSVGDEIEVGDHRGVVQEVTVFVTHVENDGRDFVVPNHLVFRHGAIVIRD